MFIVVKVTITCDDTGNINDNSTDNDTSCIASDNSHTSDVNSGNYGSTVNSSCVVSDNTTSISDSSRNVNSCNNVDNCVARGSDIISNICF